MAQNPSTDIPALSKYIFGTANLRDANIPFPTRVQMARRAMETGVWFHTSHTYGSTPQVLRAAFEEDPPRIPKVIVKIGWSNFTELREIIRQNIEPLGIDHIDIGQLCLGGELADQFRTGGKCYDDFRALQSEGLVRKFVLEVFPWTSKIALEALRVGHSKNFLAAHIFYLNPLQRFASNELWDELQTRNEPIIAMRTVGGGNVHRLRDVPGAAWKDYLRQRAAEVAPIFERSGCQSWTEFCMRFAFGFPNVRATVGATNKPRNLDEFLKCSRNPTPLPAEIQSELLKLQSRWSDETDIHAEPWSM
jgi:predicted aldo/keto reductase-like oxidoreductase